MGREKCTRCSEGEFRDATFSTYDLDWNDIIVEGKQCLLCGCSVFEIDNIIVTEFSPREMIDSFESATYTTSDYNKALNKHEDS